MSRLWIRLLQVAAATVWIAGCTSGTAPLPTVTVLVTNETCASGSCVPLEIHGFVPKSTVPGQPPWGFLLVGYVSGASACLTMPASHTLTIHGGGASYAIRWTVADPVYLTAKDSAGYTIRGYTEEFVPADAPGWNVGFGGAAEPHLAASSACRS